MIRLRAELCLSVAVVLFSATAVAAADDAWVQLKTPNFTVVANGGDRRARDIALQFERYRTAIQSAWPWARTQLDRPVVVIAAKDEATMKMLAPQYWEKGSRLQPASVFATAPDAYFITLRSDIRADDNQNTNPYQTSYWSYTSLALASAFEHPLPLWFRNGFAAVLSNSLVRDDHIDFGRPLSDALRTLNTGSRLRIVEFLTLDAKSRYYSDAATRPSFDAQCWAVVHYLLFGRPDDRADRVNELAKLLLDGKSSVEAVQQVFGSVDALQGELVRYMTQQVFRYASVKTPTTISPDTFMSQPLDAGQVAALRARYHVAMGRTDDARALVDAAKARTPVPVAFLDVDAFLLDRQGKRDDARAVYAKAAEANSDSFFSLYRLASLEMQPNASTEQLARIEALLRRSTTSNTAFAPAHTLLAEVLTSQNRGAEAVEIAKRAATLDPGGAAPRLALARALWTLSRREEARGQALAARTFADSDQEHAAVQSMLDFFERAAAAAPR